MFKKAEFISSASAKEHFPRLLCENGKEMDEIAFVGRSNVGKSSLINHLTHNKKLAHVSSKPGKTRLVNFFTLDQKCALIDLPGYGFAKVSKSIRDDWGALTEDYLTDRKQLKLILHLIDARHPPTKDDLAFAKWATHFKKPFLTVFTKADKLNRGALDSNCRNGFAKFVEILGDIPSTYIPYSIKDAKSRIYLMKEIEQRMSWD